MTPIITVKEIEKIAQASREFKNKKVIGPLLKFADFRLARSKQALLNEIICRFCNSNEDLRVICLKSETCLASVNQFLAIPLIDYLNAVAIYFDPRLKKIVWKKAIKSLDHVTLAFMISCVYRFRRSDFL